MTLALNKVRIPESAVDQLAKRRHERNRESFDRYPPPVWEEYDPELREQQRQVARKDLEAAYPRIREAVLEELREAAQALPRWTGAHIAATERDGEYVEKSALDAALKVSQVVWNGDEDECWDWQAGKKELGPSDAATRLKEVSGRIRRLSATPEPQVGEGGDDA